MPDTHTYDFRWHAPARPRSGTVLAGEIIHGATRLGAVSITRVGVLRPVWDIDLEVQGVAYPGPRYDDYREALRVAHAVLRNGIEPGYYDRETA